MTWKPSITTGTHTPDGLTRLHPLMANRDIEEGDYLIEYEDDDYEEMDDQELDSVRDSARALSMDVDWDDMGLSVKSIDWDEYPARLQWETEQGFLDHINKLIAEQIDAERAEDDDTEAWFELAIDSLGKIDELTPYELECAVIDAVAESESRAQL